MNRSELITAASAHSGVPTASVEQVLTVLDRRERRNSGFH